MPLTLARRLATLAAIAVAAAPGLASATCIEITLEDGRRRACCQAPGGPMSCTASGESSVDEPSEPTGPTVFERWSAAAVGRLNPELVASTSGGGPGPFVAADGIGRLLYRWETSGDWLDTALQALAIGFVGNELGLEVRGGARVTWDAAGAHTSEGLLAARLSTNIALGRWRVPSLLSLLPEVGALLSGAGPPRLELTIRLPFRLMLTEHLGVEAELAVGRNAALSAGVAVAWRF